MFYLVIIYKSFIATERLIFTISYFITFIYFLHEYSIQIQGTKLEII